MKAILTMMLLCLSFYSSIGVSATINAPTPMPIPGPIFENLGQAKIKDAFTVLYTNTSISNHIKFSAAADYQFTVNAYGSVTKLVYPIMNIYINGVLAKSFNVDGPALKSYSFIHPIAKAGVYNIKINFSNNANAGLEDRNLYVSDLSISYSMPTAKIPSALPASSMGIKTGGKITGNAWVLSGNSFAAQEYSLISGKTYKFDISAYGSSVLGVYPNLNVYINDILIQNFNVNSVNLQNFIIKYTAKKNGLHLIKLEFNNDQRNGKEDRNLYLQSLTASLVDVTAPIISVKPPTGPITSAQSAVFNFTISDSESGVNDSLTQCQLDAEVFKPCSSPKSYSNLAIGSHTLRIKSFDKEGNQRVTSAYPITVKAVEPPPAPVVTPVYSIVGASILPAIASANSPLKIAASIKASLAADKVNISMEIRNSSTGKPVFKKTFSNQSFLAKTERLFAFDYILPANFAAGNYYMVVGVFNANWTITHFWDNHTAPLVVLSSPSEIPNPIGLVGVNLSGAEINGGAAMQRHGWEYIYPTTKEMDYYASKGMKIIRLPFDLNRLQPKRSQPLNSVQLGYIDTVVKYAKTKNLIVILDPHNYGKMKDANGVSRVIAADPKMPASHFSDFWSRLATAYLNHSNVMFNLMNEPVSHKYNNENGVLTNYILKPLLWKEVAVGAIDAIRKTGSKHKILIPGISWTGAHSWVSSGNAAAWTGFDDINFAYEVHQYLDSYSSGMETTCPLNGGSKRLVAFTNWARENGVQGFLGEIGWPANAPCLIEGNKMLNYMSQNTDVWMGLTYWSGGPWTSAYFMTIEPSSLGKATQVEKSPMAILKEYIKQ